LDEGETVTAAVTRRFLALVAAATYAIVFLSVVLWERPGLGTGHFFYLAIALLALATGPLVGAAGGLLAIGLYALAIMISPRAAPEVLTLAMVIRAVTFVSMGALIGWYAARNRSVIASTWSYVRP
jgi:hypothetical protein